MRMLCSLVALLISVTNARAQGAPPEEAVEAPKEEGRPSEKGTLGLDIIIGEPTGITAKLYLQDDQAVQVAVGGSFIADAWQLSGEYVFHPWILQDRDTFVLPV